MVFTIGSFHINFGLGNFVTVSIFQTIIRAHTRPVNVAATRLSTPVITAIIATGKIIKYTASFTGFPVSKYRHVISRWNGAPSFSPILPVNLPNV